MSLKTRIQAGIAAVLTGAADVGRNQLDIDFPSEIALANGTTTGKADRIFSDQRTLAASAAENLDLAGSLTNALGEAVVFAKIKAIYVRAADGNTNNVVVGNVANGFVGPFGAATESVAIPPGGAFLAAAPKAGWPVTANTADLIKIANSGAGSAVIFDLVIVGTSA